jgi:hypothetical protein
MLIPLAKMPLDKLTEPVVEPLPTVEADVSIGTEPETNQPTESSPEPAPSPEPTPTTDTQNESQPPSVDDFEPTQESWQRLQEVSAIYLDPGDNVIGVYDFLREHGYITPLPSEEYLVYIPARCLVYLIMGDLARYIEQLNVVVNHRSRTHGEAEAKAQLTWVYENAKRLLPHLLYMQAGRVPDWLMGLHFIGFKIAG